MDIYRAIAESCDVFFYQVGLAVGVDTLAKYAAACGLGAPTGIPLDNEAGGLIPTAEWKKRRIGRSWQKGETLNVAIGQGYNLVTPLQLLVMISAIGNGGTRYEPHIIHHISTADNHVVQKYEPVVKGRLAISAKTLSIVRKGLWQAVNSRHGTARGIQLKDIPFSCKSGSAQLGARK
ncbi:MAG: penicillin-binding transpeptidase domain-containing protein, partial [Deltaproteobacteria bacterium]